MAECHLVDACEERRRENARCQDQIEVGAETEADADHDAKTEAEVIDFRLGVGFGCSFDIVPRRTAVYLY